MTPQTVSGLRAEAIDLDGQRVPMQACSTDEINSLMQYHGVLRVPATPHQDVEHISELVLGPTTDAFRSGQRTSSAPM